MAKRKHVAIVLDLTWPYKRHHGVFAGTQEYAEQHNHWDCTIDAYIEHQLNEEGAESGYDGIIARATQPLADAAKRAGIPLVNVLFSRTFPGVQSVAPDFHAAGRMAADHLMARGFRKFGFLGWKGHKFSDAQQATFKATVTQAGFSYSAIQTPNSFDSRSASWQKFTIRMNEWIDTWELPIGIGVSDDVLSRYLISACRRKGISVPTDAAIVGTHNETTVCTHPAPSISSIEIGYERIGYRAAELLEDMMNGTSVPGEPILLEPAILIPRQSSDAVAVDDPLVAAAMRFISENSHEQIHVTDVATAVHVNRRTLERRFRQIMDRSIAEEILRLRVERVKRQLVEGEIPIKNLANTSGFSDPLQMRLSFKRVVGVTPRAYRKMHQREKG
jgi:LacI family transcriptional regulator